jgi:hypothetical protein
LDEQRSGEIKAAVAVCDQFGDDVCQLDLMPVVKRRRLYCSIFVGAILELLRWYW